MEKFMNNNEYRINALPAKTWYQLNMNDTRLLWDDNLVPCDMDTKGCDNVCSDVNAKDYSDIENAVLTGAGKEADVLFEAGIIVGVVLQWFLASSSISSTGIPIWYNHSAVIS